jgi:DNA-binding GntR family transcriptional regulator
MLLDAMLLGKLKPGARIKQAAIANKLGIGAGTFHEALQALADCGLITRKNGTRVTVHTVEDAKILFAVRDRLEPLLAAAACQRLTPAQARQIELHLHKMKRAMLRRDFSTFLKHDLAFHECIWKVPQMPTLDRMCGLVLPPLFVFLRAWYSREFGQNPARAGETLRKVHEDHMKLLAVLKAGDPKEARDTFARVIRNYWQSVSDLGTKPTATRSPQPPAGSDPLDGILGRPDEAVQSSGKSPASL